MSEAICRTCGGTPGNHQPSMFDPDGIGDPGHKMNNPHLSIPSDDKELNKEVAEFELVVSQAYRTGKFEKADAAKAKLLSFIESYAQKKYQEDVKSVKGTFEQAYQEGELKGRIDERNVIALDNYRGKTFSQSTDWKAKYEKFVESNNYRLDYLESQYKERSNDERD